MLYNPYLYIISTSIVMSCLKYLDVPKRPLLMQYTPSSYIHSLIYQIMHLAWYSTSSSLLVLPTS